MKVRIITGVVAALFAVLVLYGINTIFFEIAIAAIATLSVYEVLHVAGVKNKVLIAAGLIFSPLLVFYISLKPAIPASLVAIGYVILLLVIMLAMYDKTRFEHVAITLFASVCIPAAMTCLALIRKFYEIYPDYTKTDCLFFVLMSLICCWMTDTGAYFVGSKFGKHKMTPKISPKKTVEGAIGGVLATVITNVIILAVFNHFFFDHTLITYWAVILTSIALSILSMLGDLSASVIKRNYGAKDFGKIMPGHGGAMDRFDSFLFVVPAMYFIITFVQSI